MLNAKLIQRLLHCFPDGFVNGNNEFIVDRRANSYFSLQNVKDETDIGVKILSWLSRDAYKTNPFSNMEANMRFHSKIINGISLYFGMSFDEDDMEIIYTYLGNGIRNDLAKRFITEGNLDTRWLQLEVRKERVDSL